MPSPRDLEHVAIAQSQLNAAHPRSACGRLLQRVRHRLGRRIDLVKEQVREQADDEEQDHQRHQDQHLAPFRSVRSLFSGLPSGPWSIWRTAQSRYQAARIMPKVPRTAKARLVWKAAEQDVELADEAVQAGQPGG